MKSAVLTDIEEIEIIDKPDYAWRGLMIDSGRRFFPMSLVKDLLDTMASVKLNVLHLHASDMCRFGVESKIFPNFGSTLSCIFCSFFLPFFFHSPYAFDILNSS